MNYISGLDLEARMSAATDGVMDEYVCWTRMQAEAGQRLEAIVARKELERQAGGGLFMWGVGNAPAAAISALARLATTVPVIFSVMKSRPKAVDASPGRTVAWTRYFDADGVERDLPANVIVTSRGDSAQGAKRVHYALMCHSDRPLALTSGSPFDVSAYRNAGGTGAPVGASQVTALLRRVSVPRAHEVDYEANLTATLAKSYWVRLARPVDVTDDLARRLAGAASGDEAEWMTLASAFRAGSHERLPEPELLLV